MYKNVSKSPIIALKYSHFRPNHVQIMNLNDLSLDATDHEVSSLKVKFSKPREDDNDLLSMIKINEKVMSADQLLRLTSINRSYCDVFNSDLSGGYNHSSGQFFADFKFSSKPPPTRVYVP